MAHVPDSLKDEDAISEPLACLLSAAMKLPVETLGDTVAVVGCGYMAIPHNRGVRIAQTDFSADETKNAGNTLCIP